LAQASPTLCFLPSGSIVRTMGCSQAKATKPSMVGAPATGTQASLTLLSPSNSQKQKAKSDNGLTCAVANLEEHNEPNASSLEVPTMVEEGKRDWPLRRKALHVFAMADKTMHGLLDLDLLAFDGSDTVFIEMLQGVLGVHETGLLSMSEFLESVRQLAFADEAKAALFLDLCQKHIDDQKEHWPLRDEALQVFRMGDRNGDCQLDMNELKEIRQSADFGTAMMNNIDIDKNGTVSKGEWLAYVKRLADQNEASAAAMLALYRKQLSESSNTKEAYVAAKTALDSLAEETVLEDASIGQNQCWWSCC